MEGIMRLSFEGWKKFFKSEVTQVVGRASRLLRLVELIRNSATSPASLKIVMGVIGRNTVGHSRDVQTLFKGFLGIECSGCRDAIEKISMGIPFPRAAGSAKLVFRESDWLNALKVLERLLRESLKSIGGVEISESYVDNLVERDYSALTGNPLKIFNIFRGLYTASRRILPLYSPYAFFVQALRGVPRFVVEKLAGENYVELVKTFNIIVEELVPCANSEYSLVSHVVGSTGDMLASAIDVTYRLHELGMPYSSRYLRIGDERGKYLDRIGPTVSSMAKLLNVEKDFNPVLSILLSEGNTLSKYRGFRMVKLRIEIEKSAEYVVVGKRRLSVETFMRGLSPHLVLGLGKLENLERRESSIAFSLIVYVAWGNKIWTQN